MVVKWDVREPDATRRAHCCNWNSTGQKNAAKGVSSANSAKRDYCTASKTITNALKEKNSKKSSNLKNIAKWRRLFSRIEKNRRTRLLFFCWKTDYSNRMKRQRWMMICRRTGIGFSRLLRGENAVDAARLQIADDAAQR
jgi:hypothetical protein